VKLSENSKPMTPETGTPTPSAVRAPCPIEVDEREVLVLQRNADRAILNHSGSMGA
jgi:hypothetical protein